MEKMSNLSLISVGHDQKQLRNDSTMTLKMGSSLPTK